MAATVLASRLTHHVIGGTSFGLRDVECALGERENLAKIVATSRQDWNRQVGHNTSASALRSGQMEALWLTRAKPLAVGTTLMAMIEVGSKGSWDVARAYQFCAGTLPMTHSHFIDFAHVRGFHPLKHGIIVSSLVSLRSRGGLKGGFAPLGEWQQRVRAHLGRGKASRRADRLVRLDAQCRLHSAPV